MSIHRAGGERPAAGPVAWGCHGTSCASWPDCTPGTGEAVLTAQARAKLDELLARLKDINLEVIVAVGHTDDTGSVSFNQRLSVRRAEAVKDYLVSRGVERNRVYAEGKGETQPIADNRTAAGRANNRRVEIELVGTRSTR